MPRAHGYYWVKFPDDPQLQIVLIQEDGNVWVFGESQPQRIEGEDLASGKTLSFQVISGPLVPPEIPKPESSDIRPLGRA
jgi:hypothetical protein